MSSQTLSHCSASAFSQWLALPPGVPESWGWFWCILQDPMKLYPGPRKSPSTLDAHPVGMQ